MTLKVFWTFEWVPDFSIPWTNKRDNKKLENWNPLPTFYFARSLYFYKYNFLSLSVHKRTFEHQSKRGSNLAIQNSPWNGKRLRRKMGYTVFSSSCPGPGKTSTKTCVHGSLRSPVHPLPNRLWALSEQPSFVKVIPTWHFPPSHSSVQMPFPLAEASLPHRRASIINSGRLDVHVAAGRESPAEVAAVSSEETKQLLTVIPELDHHLLCTEMDL